MLLWRSDRFRKEGAWNKVLCAETKRGKRVHDRHVCIASLLEHLALPDGMLDIWLELHDRATQDRLRITVASRSMQGIPVEAEGKRWGWLTSAEERLLRRLGLIDGKRKCLWLEVWYREVNS